MSDQAELETFSVRGAQEAVDASIQALGGYWPPLANLARLMEECGELARAVNQREGSKPVKANERAIDLAEELGDVLYVTLALANSLRIDGAGALFGAIDKANRRATRTGGQS